MGDIIERSLSLGVVAEDEASDVLAGIGDQVDDLQARFETAFAGMTSYAEDAASGIADAANEWVPQWISQLEELETAGSSSFEALATYSGVAASEMADSAGTVATGWAASLDTIESDAASVFLGITASGQSTATEAAAQGDTFAAGWSSAFDKVEADAATAAAGVNGAFSDVPVTAATDGDTMAANWEDGFEKVIGDADSMVTIVQGYLDGIVTSFATDGDKMVTDWSEDYDKMVADAETAAAKIEAAFGGVDATAVGGGIGVKSSATSEEVTPAEVGEAESAGVSVSALEGASADAGAGAAGAGLLSGGVLALLGGSLTLGGADASIGGIQNIGFVGEQLGESTPKAFETYLASSAISSSENVDKIIARLENNIGKVELAGTPELSGRPISEGLGREAVEPTSLSALLSSGGATGTAAGLDLLFGSSKAAAENLQQMDPQEQLADIATKMEDIKNANERTQIASDLFGARSGVSVLPLLANFQSDMSSAEKLTASGGGADILSELEKELSGSGKKGMADYQEELKLGQVGLEVGLTELTPTLTRLVGAIDKLEGWLDKEGGTVHKVEHAVSHVATGGAGGWESLAPVPFALAGDAESAVHDVTGVGSGALTDIEKGASDVAGWFGIGSGTPSASAATESIASAQDTAVTADEAAAKKYGINALGLIASQVNESGLEGDRYEGSSMTDPTKGSSAHTGLAQFSQGTWESDYEATYGKKPTSDIAASYSDPVQAMVEAHTLKTEGLDESKSPLTAANSITTGFELAGAKGDAQDEASNSKFLQQYEVALTSAEKHDTDFGTSHEKTLTKAESDTKEKAPEIPKAIDTALLSMVTVAEAHGKDFSSATDKMLKDAEAYLSEADPRWTEQGKALVDGLEQGIKAEMPGLESAINGIVADIESKLRTATETKSPSELTARVGEDLMAGLGVGIARSSDPVASLAAEHGATVAQSLSGSHTVPGSATQAASGPTLIELHIDGQMVSRIVADQLNESTKLIGRFN